MSVTRGTVLLPRDFGAAWGARPLEDLARNLTLRLDQPVELAAPNKTGRGLPEAIRTLVERGARQVVLLPVGLLPVPDRGSIPQAVAQAKQHWPGVGFHHAQPLDWLDWAGWVRATAEGELHASAAAAEDAAALLVGPGGADRLLNADLPRLAHLVQAGSTLRLVRHAFLDGTRPTVAEALGELALLASGPVAVVPWLLPAGETQRQLSDAVSQAAQGLTLKLTVAVPDLSHPTLVDRLAARHDAVFAEMGLPATTDSATQRQSAATSEGLSPQTISAADAAELRDLDRRISALLPPEYRGRYAEVRPQSMGSAGLKYDAEGRVAWDEIWTSFCDLALAGGPPHRGTLLEPVTPAEALADLPAYQSVVAEIERGVRLVTGLPVVASRTPGWVGVRCHSEEMAIWLMRAILVENVLVRREADVLYLPAAPEYTLKREIKNVVTAIAKTVHYWTAHLKSRPAAAQDSR